MSATPLSASRSPGHSPARTWSVACAIRNGFDILRLFAAALVIFGHAYPLTGQASPGFLGNDVQTIAVKIFFVTSGFLITQSWMSDPSALRFAIRRALRIMPALVVVVLLSVLVLGPALSRFSLPSYFLDPATRQYLWNVALYPIYNLPGVFESNTYPIAVNGSLWTLPVEVSMYVMLPFVLGRNVGSSRLALPVFAILFIALGLAVVRISRPAQPPVFYGTNIVDLLEVAAYFQIGAVYAAFGLERYSRPLLSICLLVLAGLLIHRFVLAECALMLLLPFATISVGTQAFEFARVLLGRNDFSYGLYLYGFPVQQTLMNLSQDRLLPLQNFALALPLALGLAALSWHLVERRALSIKPARRGLSTPQ